MQAFFDIDTQIDFMFPAGALYTAGAEKLLPAIARLNRYAAANGIPLISTTCAHTEEAEEFRIWPPHCILGTVGQQKPACTLTATGQTIIAKNELDLFSNPALLPLLDRLGVDECVVYGVLIEYCVRLAVMGLLRSGRKVRLVSDATLALDEAAGKQVLEELQAAGTELTTLAARVPNTGAAADSA